MNTRTNDWTAAFYNGWFINRVFQLSKGYLLNNLLHFWITLRGAIKKMYGGLDEWMNKRMNECKNECMA